MDYHSTLPYRSRDGILESFAPGIHWRIFKENRLYLGFKNIQKKGKPDKSSSLRKLEFMPRNLG
jgi:hypothetical protein